MTPQRIQLSRKKGFNLQEYSRSINGLEAVKVDRSTKYGNPFYVAKKPDHRGLYFHCTTAEEAVRGFHRSVCNDFFMLDFREEDLKHLRGKNIACWCPLPENGEPDMCHGAVLLELANQ